VPCFYGSYWTNGGRKYNAFYLKDEEKCPPRDVMESEVIKAVGRNMPEEFKMTEKNSEIMMKRGDLVKSF
jgi:hypothetical protein